MSDETEKPAPRDPWAPPADVPVAPGPATPGPAAPVPGAWPPPPVAPPPPAPGGPAGYGPYPTGLDHLRQPAYPAYPMGPWGTYGGGWPMLPPEPRNGPGVTAMTLGIVAACLAALCVGAVLGLPLGIAAIVLGVIGLRRVRRGEATNKSQALAGVIVGAVAVALSAVMIALFVIGGVNDWFEEGEFITSDAGFSTLSEGATATYDDGLQVTVSAMAESPSPPSPPSPRTDAGPGDALAWFTVTVENTGDGTAHTSGEDISVHDHDTEEYLDLAARDRLPGSIPPGGTATVDVGVVLPDSTAETVEIEVAPGYEYDYAYWEADVPQAG